MVRSVAIKVGMLSATLGLMWGMGWPVVDLPPEHRDQEAHAQLLESQTVQLDKAGLVPGKRVNVNAGTLPELESLPGIGPVLAGRIVDYRAQHGPFSSLHELTQVPGIGKGRLTRLLPLITIHQLTTDHS